MRRRLEPIAAMAGAGCLCAVLAIVRGGAARQVLAGYRQAWASRPYRRPMRWSTVWRMTRLGRPPVL